MVAVTDRAAGAALNDGERPIRPRRRRAPRPSSPLWQGRAMLAAGFILGAVTLLLSIALLICIAAPGSAPAALLARVLPIPDVPAAAYVRNLDLASKAPPPQRRLFLKAAERAVWEELRVAPMKSDAWLQLAYVRLVLRGGYGPDVAAAYQDSYFVAPLDPAVARWRIRFGLEAWPQLSPDLQKAVRTELQAMWSLGQTAQEQMAQIVQSIRNPAGREAGADILKRLGWKPPSS
jgi:hypothetical protein